MEFRILGPVEAVTRGEPVALGGPRQRALLALLLARAGEVVPADTLAEALWPDSPPDAALRSLHVAVSSLRKAGVELATRAPGYVLRVESEALDAARFEGLAREGRFEEALALWRGPAFGDAADVVPAEALRLEERRLAAQEELLAARGTDAVPELEAFVAEHPLRERPRALLMHALYRAGRQADALELYRSTRELLVEELGIEPSTELQELQRLILEQSPELAAPARARPPVPPTPIVGREREIADVRALLERDDVRLVTLTGPGGSGKTRLALELAAGLAEVAFVPLATVDDSRLVAPAIAAALGVDSLDELGARDVVLVLDNFEQLLDAAPLVSELLARAPGLTVLATSRSPLHLSGEHEYPVPPLPGDAAAQLFVERARAVQPSFAASDDVREICARLDGLPLAIELAAARVKVLQPKALLERLDLALLVGGARDRPERQRTLEATIDWSYRLLTPDEQTAYVRFSVFAGGATLEDAEAVCETTLDVLASLVDHSLLRERDGRLSMLQTIRGHASQHLDDDTRARHLARCLALALRAETEIEEADQAHWLSRLDAEHDNLRAALAFAAETNPNEALRIAAALRRFWLLRGHLDEGRRWIAQLLDAACDADPVVRSSALNGATMLAGEQGDLEAAEQYVRESLELARAAGDPQRIVGAISNLGVLLHFGGDPAGAIAHFKEAYELRRAIGDEAGTVTQLDNLACAYATLGDDRAIPTVEEAVATARAHALPRQLATALRTLARLSAEAGDHGAARDAATESLRIEEELASPAGAAAALELFAGLAVAEGRFERAATLLGAAAELRGGVGARRHPDTEAWYRETVRAVEEHLDAEALAAATARGGELSLGDAVAYTLLV